MPSLVNITTGQILNYSGIQVDQAKANEAPAFTDRDGYREEADYLEQSVTRRVKVAWDARHEFRQWVLGYSWSIVNPSDPTKGKIMRSIPAQHPEMPWMYAVSARMLEGMGALGKNAEGTLLAYYDNQPVASPSPGVAAFEVIYRPLDYDIRSESEMQANSNLTELQRYVTRHETYSMQALPVPTGNFRFVGTSDPVPISAAAMTLLFPTKELTYTWHAIPDVPEAAIANCQGKVNSAVFDAPVTLASGAIVGGYSTGGFAAETLLMLAPEKRRRRNAAGRVVWDVIYKFLWRPQGWNYFPQLNGTFAKATRGGGVSDPTLYPTADFATLFQAPLPVYYQGSGG